MHAMENDDSVKIRLESTLKLAEAGKGRFDKLGPLEFYHQFDISLKEYLKNEAAKYGVIGTEKVDYTYQISGNGIHVTKKDTISNAAGLETLTLQYGSSELKAALEKAVSDETAVKVTADITLTYPTADQFPVRNLSDGSDASGISPVGVSRIANTASQLPITSTKRSEEDKNRYYITNRSRAKLTYFTVDEIGTGDTTRQLGVNPSDEKNNLSDIHTKAVYDYSNVDETVLAQANSIRYTLELFQKNDSGTYDETASLPIGDYLQEIRMDKKSPSPGVSSCYWTEAFEESDNRHVSNGILYTPLTGEAFEKKGYAYANYKVRLTVVLLDASGNELDGTKASDYIIYTNARISQEILQALQGTASDHEQG